MDVKITMRNPYQEENLMRMFAWMEWCGNVGHSTNFNVLFDGDGTAKIHCNFETEELKNKYSQIRQEVRDKYNKGGEKDPEYFEFGI